MTRFAALQMEQIRRITLRFDRFLQEYYATVREAIRRYPGMESAFPEFLLGSKSIFVNFGIDGVVVIIYPARKDDFHYGRLMNSVGEIVEQQSGQMTFGMMLPDRGTIWLSAPQFYNNGMLARPLTVAPWELAIFMNEVEPEKWTPEMARARAIGDVQTFLAAYLMRQPTTASPDDVVRKLFDTISEF